MIDTKGKIRLHQFGKRFIALSNKLPIGTQILTPLNYKEEKEKFLASETYSPLYHYAKSDTSELHKDIPSLIQELDSLALPQDLKLYFRSALESLSTDIDLIDAIGTDSFAEVAADVFRYDLIESKSFLAEASTISFNEPGKCKLHCAEEMAEKFKEYLDELGLEYSVIIDNFNDHIIRVGTNKLIIGAKVKRFSNNVDRLIVHEIESHIFQRHNIQSANNPLLKIIPRDIVSLWGEGLAVYNEVQSGTITRSAYETYYYRVKAVEMLHKSFREIFNYLSKYVTAEKAFMITYRVKRGMGRTDLPGGYAKDASYLLGYKTIDSYIKSGGDITLLYASRFPVLGELLYDHELLNQKSIILPKFLTQQTMPNKQVYTSSTPGISFLSQGV